MIDIGRIDFVYFPFGTRHRDDAHRTQLIHVYIYDVYQQMYVLHKTCDMLVELMDTENGSR